ncbi:thioredoxin domain-containing protein [Staphylococcus epidermidis]|nr:thioredoxin domain-containing protein [Staphylococcus epidermidis]MCG1833552.1 thioredoxin domain-containing protein [Staphylococcus epidermidis]MCG2178279.1 thioredoxin domain-containing protein [Staphylococcus epidermidis]
MICLVFILVGCLEEKENKIIIYEDYKYHYCKKVETNIVSKLHKFYIDKDKVDYKFVNIAFLCKDAIKGSRAGHAV